jgi:hypothetical protein
VLTYGMKKEEIGTFMGKEMWKGRNRGEVE